MSGAYLRPDAIIEPLFHQWPVDVFLIPPATAALTLQQTLLPILKSFLQMPQAHASAVANPAFAGGPFVDVEIARADEVRQLLERTEGKAGPLVELTAALKALEALVLPQTTGGSLEAMYRRVPEALKGYVELAYDLHHRATWRLFEGLLYRSRYFQRDAQLLALSLATSDRRPFAYSTPRLAGADRLLLQVPFDDLRVDALARARLSPVDPRVLAEELGVSAVDRPFFEALFTPDAPAPAPPRHTRDGVRVSYHGHACVLIESAEATVLVDPTFATATEGTPARRSYAHLPEHIDLVLITHAHADHFNVEALLQLRHRVGQIVVPASGGRLPDPALNLLLGALGFKNVRAVSDLERVDLPGGNVTALPFLGEHGDLDIHTKSAYCIRLNGRAVVVAADATGLQPEQFDLIHAEIGAPDVLFAAMEPHGAPLSWGYGAFFSKPPPRKIDLERRQRAASQTELVEMLRRLRPKRFFNYAMGLEPWLHHLMGIATHSVPLTLEASDPLTQFCRAQGIDAQRLYGFQEMLIR